MTRIIRFTSWSTNSWCKLTSTLCEVTGFLMSNLWCMFDWIICPWAKNALESNTDERIRMRALTDLKYIDRVHGNQKIWAAWHIFKNQGPPISLEIRRKMDERFLPFEIWFRKQSVVFRWMWGPHEGRSCTTWGDGWRRRSGIKSGARKKSGRRPR